MFQQFYIAIMFKPGKQMTVPDALSRCHPHLAVGVMDSSPAEDHPNFPFVPDTHTTDSTLPYAHLFRSLKATDTSDEEVNNVVVLHPPVTQSDFGEGEYDAVTEDIDNGDPTRPRKKRQVM